jgi:hypothetical protein
MDEANGQKGGNNSSRAFVLTAFISFGMFDMISSINREEIYCVRVQRFDRP